MQNMKTPGDRVRAGLAGRGMTAAQLAEKLGFSRQNMQRFLSNETGSSKYWPAIADALGCSVEWLTTGNGEAPPWAKPQNLADAISVLRAEAEARSKAEGISIQEAMARIALESLGVQASDENLTERVDRQKATIAELSTQLAEERKARLEAERTLEDRVSDRSRHQRTG